SFWLMMANRPMENHFLTWTCAMLLGACVAFLFFNFNPATLFMGDTGALLIALWIGAGSIEGDFKTISGLMLATPIVLLGIPLLEVASSFGRRLKSRKRIFQADSQHMHHRLLKLGFRHRSIVLFYYGVTFLLGMLGYLIAPSSFNAEGDPIPRISDPKMVYGMMAVIGGGVFLGYAALVSIEKRFEFAILDITRRYERGNDIDKDLHELVGDETLEEETEPSKEN
ncbi:MAG: undecaprenyl/decaprenyl-phosphate alpha-N-acetylglucosaminyl 1-phosphate transferase, partial [Candidatus Omnitrophica bacterium]|nr:undecaprenyl/decaprenyl-phosphate alpha-N-acetylglucosaminyl 1-phosphate transferase [Candidatus Omnitrophota bacterium]